VDRLRQTVEIPQTTNCKGEILVKGKSVAATLAGVAVALTLLGGCGRHFHGRYMEAVTRNQQGLQELRLGMSRAEVYAIMGNNEVIRYKRINFVDPWRSESFLLVDGTHVFILFYMTEPSRRYSMPADQSLTPIVLENDQIAGWGWSYLRRNTDRYGVTSHQEQR